VEAEGRREEKGRGKEGREEEGPVPLRKFLDPPMPTLSKRSIYKKFVVQLNSRKIT